MIVNTKESYKWIVLTLTFLLMLTFAISLQALPPIFDNITQDIALTNSQAGTLMSAYAIPGIFLPFLVAYLANRYSKKNLILGALLILILGLIAFSQANSFISLLIYRIISGIGSTVLVILAPLLVTIFFQDGNMGIAMGIFNAAVPFGTVVAANLFGYLGSITQWRTIILGIAGFVGLVLIISFFALHLPKEDNKNNKEKEDNKENWFKLSLLSLPIIWALANSQLLSYVTFSPQYYQGLGMTVQRSGLLASLIMLIPIFASPIVGIIIDKKGWKKPLLLIGSIVMGLSFILIGRSTTTISLWAIGLGLGFAPIPVLVFALLHETVEPHLISIGLGMLTAASNLGVAVGPAGFGLLLDSTGKNFQLGFTILGLLSLGIVFVVSKLRLKDNT